MIVVSNTTPLIGLASIGRFDLLHAMFGEITIPQAVYDEASSGHGRGAGGRRRITCVHILGNVPASVTLLLVCWRRPRLAPGKLDVSSNLAVRCPPGGI